MSEEEEAGSKMEAAIEGDTGDRMRSESGIETESVV